MSPIPQTSPYQSTRTMPYPFPQPHHDISSPSGVSPDLPPPTQDQHTPQQRSPTPSMPLVLPLPAITVSQYDLHTTPSDATPLYLPNPHQYISYPAQKQDDPNHQQAETKQPEPTAGMVVSPGGGGSRNVKDLPPDKNGDREWSNGICGCCSSCGTCCIASFCPCLIWSQNKTRLEYLVDHGSAHPSGGDMCTGSCCMHAALTLCFGLGWIFQIGTRSAVRGRYHIRGGGCADCCTVFWCSACALTQESSELELEERNCPGPQPH